MKLKNKIKFFLPLLLGITTIMIPISVSHTTTVKNEQINYDEVKNSLLSNDKIIHNTFSESESSEFGGISEKEFINKALYFIDFFKNQNFTLNDINNYLEKEKKSYNAFNSNVDSNFNNSNSVILNAQIIPSKPVKNNNIKKNTYNLLKNLRIANAATASVAAALGVAAASMYAFVVPSFGSTLPIAIGLTTASAAVAGISGILTIVITSIDKDRSDWEKALSTGTATYKVGNTIAKLAKALNPIVKMGKFLKYVPLLGSFIEVCSAILSIISAVTY